MATANGKKKKKRIKKKSEMVQIHHAYLLHKILAFSTPCINTCILLAQNYLLSPYRLLI